MCLASIVMTESLVPRLTPQIVDFATAPSETTVAKPPADRLLQGDPQQTARNYFSDSTGRFEPAAS
jgi:hypothetical protein